MIIYQETKKNFLADIEARDIEEKISGFYYTKLGKRPSPSEKKSWKNSLTEMYYVLNNEKIPNDSKVAIEYNLPTSNYRVDFIISGIDESGKPSAVLIELKQWEIAEVVLEKDAIVGTLLGKNPLQETLHPSYQVWSYLQYIQDYSEFYRQSNCDFKTCVYLHNYRKKNNEPLLNQRYSFYTERSPLFFNKNKTDLINFISDYIKGPDAHDVIRILDYEKKRPSIALQKDVASLIKGNKQFILLDSQKKIFEEIRYLCKLTKRDRQKRVVIVEGGPGTGKSVLAFQLLAHFLQKGLSSAYVSKNNSLRKVFSLQLTKDKNNPTSKTRVDQLLRSSESFSNVRENEFDCLIIDEAHRLSIGMFKKDKKRQIEQIINSARLSIFFVDDLQIVTSSDIGTKKRIKEIAKEKVIKKEYVKSMKLHSQFRMNGSNNFLNWLDNALTLKKFEENLTLLNYDFRIINTVDELYQKIKKLNNENQARILAGYCWDWKSKKVGSQTDINLSNDFQKKWNLIYDKAWAINEKSFEQVGAIHAIQGLELDYTGVIIGDDLGVEDGKLITKPLNRAKTDKSLKGLIGPIKKNDAEAKAKANEIILNTYRVLLTRATKGCYVYFTNPEVKKYFQKKLNKRD